MQLKIEFLGARKQGTFIMLDESIDEMGLPAFDILENDPISITFFSDTYFSKVLLLLGDREFECSTTTQQDGFFYKWMPERFEKGFKALFHNFFGVAELALKLLMLNR